MTFEQGFAEAERAASAAAKAGASLTGIMKQLEKAAAEGDIAKMRKLSARLGASAEAARQEAANAAAAWPFSPDQEEQYLRDSYQTELVESANAANCPIQRRDEGLIAFPSVLRVLPSERALKLNRKKLTSLRPSRVVRTLLDIQARKQKGTPEALLEVLHRAYRLVAGPNYGTTLTLASLYEALTLLPGSNTNYTQTDFIRDLFLLDRSGVTRTRSGATYSLPASTGTKSPKGAYSFTAPDGETVTYYAIRFTGVSE